MKKIFRYIILAILALVVAIGAGYGIINKMQQQEVALSERAMLNLEALARGESPPGGCENPPGGGGRECKTIYGSPSSTPIGHNLYRIRTSLTCQLGQSGSCQFGSRIVYLYRGDSKSSCDANVTTIYC